MSITKGNNTVLALIVLTGILSLNYTIYRTSLHYKTSGSHPGSTGAPLDQTCAQSGCHSDASIELNAVNNTTLVFSKPDSTYDPGQTYTLTLKTKAFSTQHVSKFGFELGALIDADSLNAGNYTITDAVRTHTLNHFGLGTDVRYTITHDVGGTPELSSGYTEWSFLWKAPPVNEGNITFYYAVNCSNNDNSEFGDKIYLSSFKIHPSAPSSLKEISNEYTFNSFYDQDSKSIYVSYDLKGTRECSIAVYDVSGKIIYQRKPSQASGLQKYKLPLGELSKGTYLVQFMVGDRKASKKILVF